jgi:elongation factor Ts
VASEGSLGTFVAPQGNVGAMVEVNSETDFVAKNPEFQAFARQLAELVATQKPADVAALSALNIGGETVESVRQKLVQKIGENITVRRFERIETDGKLETYVHPPGKIGVMVEYEGNAGVAKDVAMHIAFAKPKFMSKDQVAEDVIATERRILEARAAESGKPPEIVAKMVDGGINKFLAEITLMGQPFVKDDKQTVEKMLKAQNSKLRSYRLLVVGEGIEKKKDDFAAEVASMTKNAA